MEIAALGLRVDGAQGIGEAADSLERLGTAAEKAEKKTGGITEGSKKAGNALAEAAKSTQQFNNALAAAASRAKSLAIELAAVALAAVSVRAAAQTLAGFEQSMASVGAVTRASSKDMKAMREEAKRLGVATEFSASQAADGFMYLGLAGWDAQQSIAAIPSVVNLATAASLGLADAANITSNIMSAYTIAAENATDVTDILAGVSSRANTDVSQLGEAMKYVGPVAASLGISVGDTAAALGILADASIQGGMGGTALRTVLTNMIKPTADAQKALLSMGLTVADINPVTNDFADIVQKLADKSISAEEAVRIFGLEGSSAILALTAAEPKLKSLTDETKRMGDEAQRMADTMRDNLKGDLLGLGSALEGVVISLGEAGLTGALRASAQAATELLREISALIDYLGGHLPAVGAAMAVTFGPKVFLAVAAGFKALSIAAISAVRAITVAVATNPIGLLAVAAAMLLGEMYSLKDEVSAIGAAWDMLSDSIQWGWNILKDGAKTAFGMMGELGDRIVTVASDFNLSWHGAFMAVTGGLDTMHGLFLGSAAALGAAFRVAWHNLGAGFQNASNGILEKWGEVKASIAEGLSMIGINVDFGMYVSSGNVDLLDFESEISNAFNSQAGGFNLQDKYIKAYGLREIDRAMKDVEKWSESTADSVATVTEELNNNSRSLVDNSKKLTEAAKAAKKFADERVAAFQKQRESISALQAERRLLEDQIKTFGMGKRAIEQLTISRLREQAAVLAGFAGSEEAIELLRLEIEEREKLLQAGFTMDGLERGKKAAEELAEASKKTHDDIERSLTDALLRGFESGKGFGRNFIDTLKNMFSSLVLRPIIQPIAAGAAGMITGALGFGGTANAQGAGGGIDPLTGASMAQKFLSGGAAGPYGMSGGMSWFTGFGGNVSNLAADLGANLTMMDGAFSNLGSTLLNNAEIIGKVADVAGQAFGYGSAIYDLTKGNYGAAAGGAIGTYFGGPIGSFLGSQLGGMLDKAFKGETRAGAYMQYDLAAKQAVVKGGPSGGYGGQATIDAATQLFGSTVDTINSVLEGVGAQAQTAWFHGMFESSKKGRGGTFAGGSMQLADGSLVDFGTNKKGAGFGGKSGTAEEMFQNLQAEVHFAALEAWKAVGSEMPTMISDMLTSIDVRALSAEQAQGLVAEISNTVGVVNSLSKAFNQMPMLNLRDLTFDATGALMQFAGGLDAITSGVSTYYQNFYSESERQLNSLSGMASQLSVLNQSFPVSKAGFRELADGLDLSTEAGQQLYATLMNMSGAAASFYDHIEQQAESSFSSISASITASRDEYLQSLQQQHQAAQKAVRDEYAAKTAAIRNSVTSVNERLRDLNSVFSALGTGIKSLRDQSELASQLHREASLRVIEDAIKASKAGKSLTNIAQLQDSIQSASKLDASNFTSLFEFERERAETVNRLKELESLTGGQIDVQELQLESLNKQLEQLSVWQDRQLELLQIQHESAQSRAHERFEKMMEEERARFEAQLSEMLQQQANQLAISDSIEAGTASTAHGLSSVQAAIDASAARIASAVSSIRVDVSLGGQRLPAFADGGYYQGGLALVGEKGPEIINFSRPGMVYTAAQSKSLMASGNNQALIEEIRRLRAEVAQLRADQQQSNMQLVKNTLRTSMHTEPLRQSDSDDIIVVY